MNKKGLRLSRGLQLSGRALAVLAEGGPSDLVRRTRYFLDRRRSSGQAPISYLEWQKKYEPSPKQLKAMARANKGWSYSPKVSVVGGQSLEAFLKNQIYNNWELCNDLESATGDFVTWVDNGDQISPDALHRLVAYVQKHPDTDIVYSDEDVIDEAGQRVRPFLKPDWSPELLLGWNYLGHLVMLRTSSAREVGGAGHDLLLRASEKARHVGHVRAVLYQAHEGAKVGGSEGKQAVIDALERRGLRGTAELAPGTTDMFQIKYKLEVEPSVDILIPTRDRLDLLKAFVDSIEQMTTYKNYRITIIDNDSVDPETLNYLANTKHNVVKFRGAFHHSRIVHAGAKATSGDVIFIANNDMKVITPDWLEAMVAFAVHSDVGAVGCHLVYPNGSTQHGGVAVSRAYRYSTHVDPGWPIPREVSAVTGAALMTRRAVWNELVGLSDVFVAYGDIDYCLRLREGGYRVIYTPLAKLVHIESASRGDEDQLGDKREFIKRWGGVVDPYMPSGVLANGRFQLNVDGNETARRGKPVSANSKP